MKKSKRAMPYWICIAIGALIFAGVASMRSIWTLSEREEILSGLCDALFVPGALLTCVGLLTFTAREGVLDIISYGFRNLLVLFAPGKHKHQHYYDYKMAKEANRGKAHMRRWWLGWRSSCWPVCASSSITTVFDLVPEKAAFEKSGAVFSTSGVVFDA